MVKLSKKEKISKVINKCVDNFEKKETELFEDQSSLFKSDFGKKFQDNYNQLIGFITIGNLISVLVSNFQSVLTELSTLQNISEVKEKILEDTDDQGNQGDEAFRSILKSISEEDLFMLITEAKEPKENESTDLLSREGITESKLVSHLVAYFSLRLYAFIDSFIQDMFAYIWKSAKREDLYEIFKFYSKSNKLNERINNLLISTDRDTKLPNLIDEVLKERDVKWYEDKAAFGIILRIRNNVAHGYYLPEIEELKEQFSYIYTSSKQRLSIYIEKYLDFAPELRDFIMRYMQNSFEIISSDLEFMMFIVELGSACIRYLSVIEKVILKYY